MPTDMLISGKESVYHDMADSTLQSCRFVFIVSEKVAVLHNEIFMICTSLLFALLSRFLSKKLGEIDRLGRFLGLQSLSGKTNLSQPLWVQKHKAYRFIKVNI